MLNRESCTLYGLVTLAALVASAWAAVLDAHDHASAFTLFNAPTITAAEPYGDGSRRRIVARAGATTHGDQPQRTQASAP